MYKICFADVLPVQCFKTNTIIKYSTAYPNMRVSWFLQNNFSVLILYTEDIN